MNNMALCLALLALVCSSHAFGVGSKNTPPVSPLDTQISRPNFLALVGAAVTANACAVSPALAKEDPDVKGTKKDPVFEACLSTCMYECTKPKGSEQKSRKECLPECKEKCATDKKQLMLGEPKKL